MRRVRLSRAGLNEACQRCKSMGGEREASFSSHLNSSVGKRANETGNTMKTDTGVKGSSWY